MFDDITTNVQFWSKVDASGDCWEWTKGKNHDGYGLFFLGGQRHRAHRFSWEVLVDDIPEGFQPDHMCRNRGCVNPDHLELVTSKVNTLRGEGVTAKNARKTHCKNGHEFTPENTYSRPRKQGGRDCKQCLRDRKQARK